LGIAIAHWKGRRRAVGALLCIGFASAACSVAPSPTQRPIATPALSLSPTATPRPLPTPTPAGRWTGIHWARVVGQADVWNDQETQDPIPDINSLDTGWAVFGWSRGYVAFDQLTTISDGGLWTETTRTSNSVDGLHWRSGGEFTRSFDAEVSSQTRTMVS
jgi:hypothetical protein